MRNWANRHINWAYLIMCALVGPVIGLVLGFMGLAGLAWVFAVIYALLLTIWLLRRKGRSMWFIPFAFIPFGWIILLVLENKRSALQRGWR